MTPEQARQASLELANRSAIAMLANNGQDGYPNIKAMLKMENEGLLTVWFSTNTSSKRLPMLEKDGRTCIYFVDHNTWEGLALVGDIDVLHDYAAKQRLWREGFEKYYPQGVEDPDYSVYRFTAKWGNYYHRLQNVTFMV